MESAAIKNYHKVILYLNTEWYETIALNFIENTESLIDLILEYPEAGRELMKKQGYRKLQIDNHNFLVYRVVKNTLIIINIMSYKRDHKYK